MNYASLSTEKVNPRSKGLDRLTPLQIVRLMNREDRQVLAAIGKADQSMARAISLIVKSLQAGGRLFLAGAGTSGRLGVIEAAECPPTFGTPPSLVQAAMAGGKSAVFQSKEGAEDSAALGLDFVRKARIRKEDVVLGIAASGVTQYVHSVLTEAKARGAGTILLTCNPKAPRDLARIRIALSTGPEILAGSTRLKAGTACKMALNILTTGSMVQLGKVYGNRMVDLQPKSRKLIERGLRLIQEIGHVSRRKAEILFQAAHRHVKAAIVMARKDISYADAVALLAKAKGFLRKAI